MFISCLRCTYTYNVIDYKPADERKCPLCSSSLVHSVYSNEKHELLNLQEFEEFLKTKTKPLFLKTNAEEIKNIFNKHTIERVDIEDIPHTDRCVLNSIRFSNGAVVHLGASRHGATIYKHKKE